MALSAALPSPADSSPPGSQRPHNITVNQAYAPNSDHEDEEDEQIHEQLDNIIAETPKNDILVVQGDWNAKVGPDAHQH